MSRLLSPILLPLDGKPKILHPEGLVLPLVSGGAVTASGLFSNNWLNTVSNGSPVLNWTTTHQRVAMFTNTITPDFDATTANSAYNAGVYNANEVSGTGYSAGGAGDASASGTIGTPTITNTAGVIKFTQNANAVWTASTITNARAALIYDNSLTPKSAFCLITFGADYSTSSGTFTIQWNASGIFTWTVH